jgi:hypothetical protein
MQKSKPQSKQAPFLYHFLHETFSLFQHHSNLFETTLGCGWLLAPLRLIFGIHEASVKIEGLAFVSSNSENISCVAFLKHKNSRKQGTGAGISLIG